MIQFIPIPFILGLLLLSLVVLILWRLKFSAAYRFFAFIFGIYLLTVIGFTLFPAPWFNASRGGPTWQTTQYILSRVNLIPFDYSQFRNVKPIVVFFREILGNILLTVPFGFLICFVRAQTRAKHIAWLGVAVGLSIELTQLVLCLASGVPYRGIDINDVILNASGVICGYAYNQTL